MARSILCPIENAPSLPAIGVALTNSFLYSIKKQSLARLERHESLKSRGARVRFHYWRKFSRADFPRPGRTRLKLCFALNSGPQALLRLIFVRSNAGSQKSRVGWHEILSVTTASRVRRDKAALSSGCKPRPATAPAGSNRSSHGGNKMAEAFGVAGHI